MTFFLANKVTSGEEILYYETKFQMNFFLKIFKKVMCQCILML